MSQNTSQEVLGHCEKFPDGRIVFVGRSAGTDTIFLAFRNAEGDDLKFKLSFEAMEAVCRLFQKPPKGKGADFPHKAQWVHVTGKHDHGSR